MKKRIQKLTTLLCALCLLLSLTMVFAKDMSFEFAKAEQNEPEEPQQIYTYEYNNVEYTSEISEDGCVF